MELTWRQVYLPKGIVGTKQKRLKRDAKKTSKDIKL